MKRQTFLIALLGFSITGATLLNGCGKEKICIGGFGAYCKELGKNMNGATNATGEFRIDTPITNPPAPAPALNVPFRLQATGGVPNYTFRLSSGSDGRATLDPVTCTNSLGPCVITPTQSGNLLFDVNDAKLPVANTRTHSVFIP